MSIARSAAANLRHRGESVYSAAPSGSQYDPRVQANPHRSQGIGANDPDLAGMGRGTPTTFQFQNKIYFDKEERSRCGSFFIVLALIIYVAAIAGAYFYLDSSSFNISAFWAFSILLSLVNLIILMLFGNYMLRGILFPYANFFIKRQLESGINRRFSVEFTRLVAIMGRMIKIMSEQEPLEGYFAAKEEIDNSTEMQQVLGTTDDFSQSIMLDSQAINFDMRRATYDINTKMAAVLDLIGLYSDINQEILDQNLDRQGVTQAFRQATGQLQRLRDLIRQLPVVETSDFNQGGGPDEKKKRLGSMAQPLPTGTTLWTYYRRDEVKNDDKIDLKILPKIVNSPEITQILSDIDEEITQFKRNVRIAVQRRACLGGFFCSFKKMFGTTEQNQMLLQKNFDGKHFQVRGHNGARLDCMFFPSVTDDSPNISTENPSGGYLDRPTFIMCNPNALLYQQMVSSPNTYWLTFFLRRDINVFCWNYRSYGGSKKANRCCLGWCDRINPLNIKMDAECVLDFVVNKMQITGKVGVYGRSLGGIASTHLAKNFPDKISALIVDRTFSNLETSSERRLPGCATRFLYKFVSFNWNAKNDKCYIEAPQCFKIATCDPLDEVVDCFSALPTGVATRLSKVKYDLPKWKTFYEGLCLIYEIEAFYHQHNDKDIDYEFQLITQSSQRKRSTVGLGESIDVERAIRMGLIQQQDENSMSSRLRVPLITDETIAQNNREAATPNIRRLRNLLRAQQDSQELHSKLYALVVIMDDFRAGPIQLRDLINASRPSNFEEFQTFLQVLEIYGAGYELDEGTDLPPTFSKPDDQIQYEDLTIEILQILKDALDYVSIRVPRNFSRTAIDQEKSSLIEELETFVEFLKDCFSDLITIQQEKKNQPDLMDFYTKKQGHLVLLNCGHRGRPSRPEEKRISRLMRKSGFIPELEQIAKEEFKRRVSVISKAPANRQGSTAKKREEKSPSPLTPHSVFDPSQALSPPQISGPAASSGAGVLLTLNNSGDATSISPPLSPNLSPSPLQNYADMIILSPSPPPGLDIDREMELIQRMREDFYESQLDEDPDQHRQSLDILNLHTSQRQVDAIDLLAMVQEEDDHQMIMEQSSQI